MYSVGRSLSEQEENFTLRRRMLVVRKKMRQIELRFVPIQTGLAHTYVFVQTCTRTFRHTDTFIYS